MIVNSDNRFGLSPVPHSLSLRNAMQVPSPLDSNPFVIAQKGAVGRGMSGLSFDGTGLFGSGLFSGEWQTWGWAELVFGVIGAYAIYSMVYQTKQTKYRMEIGAGRRRKRRAGQLREKAKRLEEQTEGIF